ncbi:Low-density lipoprotein (LDL) receptor class A repeat,Low-density lipoprotein (LDL) receptor class A [Cinara cedri]|uniref:Low-density lipoprotein (LDL) receptor class A repeat,Low-density lipoprotein (LDL) receptor class A n=1 Tax=Cinara cedri TaxID=506608 RepID=A0A5E4N8U7_9HEMI|nr:Low-density lipoprotein (LDL) receptor class A repeat,Low-density lipoprotein (LDL) receptor class A [Cinara cedri]
MVMAMNVTHGHYWLTCLCLIFGASISGARKLEKRQIESLCSVEDPFYCANGRCIDSLLICDGHADCLDASDETRHLCFKLFKNCPNYAFHCSYGACVHLTAKCNGINDCVDGSDENLLECKANVQNTSKCK